MDIAVADFGSNPMMRESMVTNMPPPPTPPTVPNADPKNPIIVPVTILQPNSMSCKLNHSSSYNKYLQKRETERRVLVNEWEYITGQVCWYPDPDELHKKFATLERKPEPSLVSTMVGSMVFSFGFSWTETEREGETKRRNTVKITPTTRTSHPCFDPFRAMLCVFLLAKAKTQPCWIKSCINPKQQSLC